MKFLRWKTFQRDYRENRETRRRFAASDDYEARGDSGVVVYVAPTKALVNQVSASMIGKYKKSYKPGIALSGTFTRDYKHNVENCQVLVTVPECLEILLLSPKREIFLLHSAPCLVMDRTEKL